MARKMLGQYIVADSEICHGQPTFAGTRIMVKQVLELVADGRDWDSIVEAWRGRFPKEAIAEAVNLAQQVFVEYAIEFVADYGMAGTGDGSGGDGLG